MSNSTAIAERQPTNTAAPMPMDAARDILAVVRALEARVAVLEGKAFDPRWIASVDGAGAAVDPSDALSAALRRPTVPDAYGR